MPESRKPRREPEHYQPPDLGALAGNHEAGCGRSRPKNRTPATCRPELEVRRMTDRGVGDCNPEPVADDVEEPAEGTTTGTLLAAPHNT